jgi:hypothetical protein
MLNPKPYTLEPEPLTPPAEHSRAHYPKTAPLERRRWVSRTHHRRRDTPPVTQRKPYLTAESFAVAKAPLRADAGVIRGRPWTLNPKPYILNPKP